MKLKNISSLAVAFSLSLMSCSDLMDKQPLDKLSETAIWSDLNLTEAFINNQYKVLPRLGWNDFVRGHQMSVFTDEATHKYNYHSLPSYRVGGMNPSTPTGLDVWSYHYNFIHGLNTFLKNADQIPTTTESEKQKLNVLKGEAYALRAWSYLDLAARYGGVVIVTEPFALNSDFKRERSTFDETLDLIVNDLDQAATLLPLSHNEANWGRMTKGAALGLKSRALLYAASTLFNPSNDIEKWKSAASAAKAVIDLGKYRLYGDKTNYSDIFLKASKNPEVLLSKGHDRNVKEDGFGNFEVAEGLGGGTDGNGYANGWSTTMVSQNLVDDFEMIDGSKFDWNNPVHASSPYTNRDPRLAWSVTTDGSPWINGAEVQFWVTERDNKATEKVYTNNNFATPNTNFVMDNQIFGRNSQGNPGKRGDAPQMNYIYRKAMDPTYDIQAEIVAFETHWVILRYAEILLNYAEAAYESGDETTARNNLNEVRQRVGMPAVNLSGQQLRDKIRHERRIELCLEGHRYFDARRWKIADQVFAQPIKGVSIVKDKNSDKKYYTPFVYELRQFPAHYYFQPIPITEIQRSGIKQNDGYN